MKSIMISIKPEFVQKILNGNKTIEILKTKPSCEMPCKVYIYCTKGKQNLYIPQEFNAFECDDWSKPYFSKKPILEDVDYLANGKVVAEFTLNKIDKFDSAYSEWAYSVAPENSEMPISETQFIQMAEQKGKLDCNDLLKYFGDEDYIAYAWHIDDLKIYDKPKELDEFYGAKECPIKDWGDVNNIGCWEYCCEMFSSGECRFGHLKLERPPQSWCYVEELENE